MSDLAVTPEASVATPFGELPARSAVRQRPAAAPLRRAG